MTVLYRLDAPAAAVAERFGAKPGEDPWSGGYCTPGKFAPVITAGREFIAGPKPAGGALAPRLVPRVWGVMPPPSAGDRTRLVASVRNPDSPFWIGNLRNSEFRCIVPATAFMEWGSETDVEGRRLRHWFTAEDSPILAMAAVWKDEEVPGFALLSRAAAGLPRELGCRSVPALLPDDEASRQAWLHGGWDRARDILDRAPPALIATTAR